MYQNNVSLDLHKEKKSFREVINKAEINLLFFLLLIYLKDNCFFKERIVAMCCCL